MSHQLREKLLAKVKSTFMKGNFFQAKTNFDKKNNSVLTGPKNATAFSTRKTKSRQHAYPTHTRTTTNAMVLLCSDGAANVSQADHPVKVLKRAPRLFTSLLAPDSVLSVEEATTPPNSFVPVLFLERTSTFFLCLSALHMVFLSAFFAAAICI